LRYYVIANTDHVTSVRHIPWWWCKRS